MNHIEAQILDLVARLFPQLFARLEAYCDLKRTLSRPADRTV